MPVVFTLIRRTDFPLLSAWLATPHVMRWWNDDPSPAAVEADYGPCVDGAEAAEVFIAHRDGKAVGLVQRYRFAAYPAYANELAHILPVPADAGSIDYLIGPTEALGKGIGTEMLAAFIERIWQDDPLVSSIIVPVQAGNRASWRALERAGLTRVAEGDLTPDNPVDGPEHLIYQVARRS